MARTKQKDSSSKGPRSGKNSKTAFSWPAAEQAASKEVEKEAEQIGPLASGAIADVEDEIPSDGLGDAEYPVDEEGWVNEDDSEEDESESDDGVDEEGMARLMKALGDDGLDDFDRAQLHALDEDEDSEDESDEDSERDVKPSEDEVSEDGSGSLGEEDSEGEDQEAENTSEGKFALDDFLDAVQKTYDSAFSRLGLEMKGGVPVAQKSLPMEDPSLDDEENIYDIIAQPNQKLELEGEDQEAENISEQEDVALEDVENIDDDVIPKQKLEIDNEVALKRIRETFQLDPSMSWTETLAVSYPEVIDVDVNDDLNRELAFYKQALHGANTARALAAKNSLPFTRPNDYFAEMVKTDAHMERIRQRLLDESALIKKSEDKRKEREGKKFGKQVQLEKLKEREKEKKGMEERLKGLKRKRKDVLDNAGGGGGDDFDIAVEDAIADRPSKRAKPGARGGKPGERGGISRRGRDAKFGFGGAGKRSKQNTRDSTDDFGSKRGGGSGGRGGRGGMRGGRSGAGGRGGGAGPKRPGKNRRIAAKSKR